MKKDSAEVYWICGKVIGDTWEFQGLFDSEEKAVNACRNKNYWVGPCVLNDEIPDHTIEQWPGAYYPHGEEP